MTDRKQVTIELTEAQKAKIAKETGKMVEVLTYDAIEDRVAPSVITPGKRMLDPAGSHTK